MFIHTVFDLFKNTSVIPAYASLTVSILKSVQTALRMVLCVTTAAKAFGNECNSGAAQSVSLVTLMHVWSSLGVRFPVRMSPALETGLDVQFAVPPCAAESAGFPSPFQRDNARFPTARSHPAHRLPQRLVSRSRF